MKNILKIMLITFGSISLPILIGIVNLSFSQDHLSSEQKQQLKEADYYFKLANYLDALKIYEDLLITEPAWPELNYKAGVCIFNSGGSKKDAVEYFTVSNYGEYADSWFYLARCYHTDGNFDDATRLLMQYKISKRKNKISVSEIDRNIEIINRARDMMETPVNVSIENIGPVINTKYPEYVPLINADESMLIFTSRRENSTGGKLDPYGHYFEDIYIAHNSDNRYAPPVSISAEINTETHDASVGLSSDGNTLIIFRTSENLKGGDLFWCKYDGEAWTKPEKFGSSINTQYNEPSACLNVDGNIMFFSSDRPGGFGGKDIYRVVQFPNGDWSMPVNLGSVVNTAYDDDAPFLHADGVTLYFSSKGHETMGGYDIFKTVFSDTTQRWSNPENPGYPINTTDDDIFFVLSTGGQRGYYSSGMSGGYGAQDIYIMRMPTYENRQLVIVKGGVFSADSAASPLRARITVFNTESGKKEGTYRSNSKTGQFMIVLSPETHYTLTVTSENYNDYEELLFFQRQIETFEIVKGIKLEKKPDTIK